MIEEKISILYISFSATRKLFFIYQILYRIVNVKLCCENMSTDVIQISNGL